MPRGPRLDAPGALHHVVVRGIEGRPIFLDGRDRQDWLDRLAALAAEADLAVLAWALLPNHAHLLVRTGRAPLSTIMLRLLTGYAGGFNRRHARTGRLFQNRYKSILVEAEAYLLELVRYIHLNPLRAGLVRTVEALARYPWCGHRVILARRGGPAWQPVDEVLGSFGEQRARARRRYLDYVRAGAALGRRPELQGGGLRRSMGGWRATLRLRRGREHGLADERILGSGSFVEAVHQALEKAPVAPARTPEQMDVLLERCAELWGVVRDELSSGSRRRAVTEARAAACRVAVKDLGLPATVVAKYLGVTASAVRLSLPRGERVLGARGLAPGGLLPRKAQLA